MRALRFLNVAVLSVLVGSAAFVYSQDEKKQDDKPTRQEENKPKQDEAKPSHPNEAGSSREMHGDKQDQKPAADSRGSARPERQENQMQGERDRQQQNPDTHNQDTRGEKQGQDHPERQAGNGRPSGRGGHIPDDRFRSSFGHEHHFNARTIIVRGQPQFQYGGYNFELVDAWPAEWADSDDIYIDYIDGEYFLFDLMHPGVRVAVFVVM